MSWPPRSPSAGLKDATGGHDNLDSYLHNYRTKQNQSNQQMKYNLYLSQIEQKQPNQRILGSMPTLNRGTASSGSLVRSCSNQGDKKE